MIERILLQSKRIQSMAAADINALVDPDVLAGIKTKDAHPLLEAFSICHEGLSNPRIVGEEARPITWPRKAVQSIKNIIKRGVKFFAGHNDDNSTEGREALGEVIASTEKEIDGLLHHVVVGYFPPDKREKVKAFDVCSQEAEWNFFEEAGNLIADTAEKITGIALGNSQHEAPAFAGAKRLGVLQAFAEPVIDIKPEPKNSGDEPMAITFKDVQDFVKNNNVMPNQLFEVESMKNDRVFGPLLDERDKYKTDFDTAAKKIEEFQKKENLSTAKTRLSEIMKEMKLTDPVSKFIEKKFENSMPEDVSDESLKGFVTNQQTDFQEIVSLFPDKDMTNIEFKTGDKVENPAAGGDAADPNDMTRAANNPLLAEDYDADSI